MITSAQHPLSSPSAISDSELIGEVERPDRHTTAQPDSWKAALKALANGAATLCVLPAFVIFRLAAAVVGLERSFPGWSQSFSLLPGIPGQYLRRAFYRLTLHRCASDASIGFGTTFSHSQASIGQGVYVGLYCSLGMITIEDDVLLASYVSVINGAHQHGISRTDVPIRFQAGTLPRVSIGQDTWIGERAVIMADVGRHCVVGAGAVVTKPVPDYAIVIGVPAKVVGYRDETAQECATSG